MSVVRTTAIALGCLAVFNQIYLKNVLFLTLGIGRTLQPIQDFNYSCRRISHGYLEGCESMRIDAEARVLYAACTSSIARTQWNPSMGHLNVSGRRIGGDYISVLDIDSPGQDGLFALRQMQITGYQGATDNDKTLAFVGIDLERLSNKNIKLWAVNHHPSVDINKNLLDQTKVGANSTIEAFEIRGSPNELVHVQTISSTAIYSPNGIAATGDGEFFVTNDRSCKVCLRNELDLLIGGGNVAYYSPKTQEAHVAANKGFLFPNGMVKGADNLFYIPSTFKDMIRVMKMDPASHTLEEVDIIKLSMPVDNLSVDENGDIYAAGFPKMLESLASLQDPYNINPPSAIFRIRKTMNPKGKASYEVTKILEDKDSIAMGGVTTALHDTKSGRLFMGGAASPYIAVCESI